MFDQDAVTGVILAGGLARRMNYQDKGLIEYNGQPMISYPIKALSKVVNNVIINANRNIEIYQQFNLPVITDHTNQFNGPLAGILAAMDYIDTDILLVIPCDSPFIKATHLKRLLLSLFENDADVAVAFDGNRLHPVFLALKTTLKSSLMNYLDNHCYKVDTWIKQHKMVVSDFSDVTDIFININCENDLVRHSL